MINKSIKESVEKLWKGYSSAILFAETDLDTENPLDESYDINDFDKKTISESKKLLEKFYKENLKAINESGLDLDTIGMDVWYTRKGHGAGFFDHSLDDDIEAKLIKGAASLGEYPSVETYNGKISVSSGRVFKEGGEADTEREDEEDIEGSERLQELMDEYDMPREVIEEYASNMGIEIEDITDLPFSGRYDSEEDFAEDLVEQGAVSNLSYYLEMTSTDMRLLAQEEADNRVDDMSDKEILDGMDMEDEANEYEELKNEIDDLESDVDDLKSKLDDYMDEEDEDMTEGDIEIREEKAKELKEEIDDKEYELEKLQNNIASLDTYDEVVDKAREELRDVYYDDIHDELEKYAVGYFVDNLGYEEEELAKNNLFRVDYEKLARDLSDSYTFIEHNGDVYVFSSYMDGGMTYAKGGRVGKMYYHILEYGDYGNIGYQGYYDTLEEAQKQVKKLSDYFPNQTFEIFADKSRKEPPITTMAKGGGVGKVSKKEMLDYLNMYFDNYSELRTIAIEEDNILTKKMLPTLDDEEIEMAYGDAKYELKADSYARGGMAKVNKKYAYFAVNKKTNKIVDGFELVSDVESLKYYANMDLKDNDYNPKDYNLLSAKTLKSRGIDPYNWDSWRKINEMARGGGVKKESLSEQQKQFIREESQEAGQGYTYRYKVLRGQDILLKEKNNTPIQKWYFYYEDAIEIAKRLNKVKGNKDSKIEKSGATSDKKQSLSAAKKIAGAMSKKKS